MLPFALSLNTDLTGANRTNFATFYGITGVTDLTNAAWRKGLMDQIGTWYVANGNYIRRHHILQTSGPSSLRCCRSLYR